MRTFMLAVTGLVLAFAGCSSDSSGVFEVEHPRAHVASLALVVPSSLVAGQSARAFATPKDSSGAPLTDRPVTWSTSSASIASVNDSGMVSAVAPGTAVVSAVSEGVTAEASMDVMAPPPPSPAPVATISVSLSASSIQIGQTANATATLYDANGNTLSGRVVAWTSSNVSVATVQANGTVLAIAAGSATIRATSEGKTNSANLSVSAAAPVPVATVSVSPASASLQVGGTTPLSATTRDGGGNILNGRAIAWSSSNPLVSTVSGSGLVTAIAAGSATITALSETKIGTSLITVTASSPPPVATVSVSPSSASLEVGSTTPLSAVTRDGSGAVLNGRVIAWSSSNPLISIVSGAGVVTAIAPGTATITALSETKVGTSLITVTAAAPPPPPGGGAGWRGNEPAGMTRITDRGFNAVVEDGFDSYGTASPQADVPFTIVSDGTAPHSPNNVLRTTYPAGFGPGGAPAHTGIPHTEYSKIYICFAVKLSANWVGNGSGVNKYLYEWTTVPHPSFFFAAYGSGSSPLEPRVMFQDMVVSPNPGFVAPNLVPGARIVRGQWQTVEIYIQGNTAGNADGVVDWYLDGVHVGHVATGIQFSSGTTAFSTFEIYPIWGGGNTSPAITATQTMDWDHLYVSGKN